jgi:hypothetical protein
MRPTDVQRQILKTVVQRFLDKKEPTPRILIVKHVKDPEIVDNLVPILLNNPNGEQLFPRVLAFECCGDSDSLGIARTSVDVVIRVLQSLFENEDRLDFKIAEVEDHARAMLGPIAPDTIQLGLYLIQEFSGIHGGIGGIFPNITFVRIHEGIGLLRDPSVAWDEHVKKYGLYLHAEQGKLPATMGSTPSGNVIRIVQQSDAQWDFFISHASEDKQEIARPLAEALVAQGLRVWYDDFSLKVGDSLRASIDRGLAHSRYGVVILSNHFFAKHWPQQELNGLATREVGGKKVILPVWHQIGAEEVRASSPLLADRKAAKTSEGLKRVIAEILDAVGSSSDVVVTPIATHREEMVFEEAVYWKLRNEMRQGPYCPVCYDDKQKEIHLTPGATKGTYGCGVCKNSFTTKEYDPRPVRRRPFSVR